MDNELRELERKAKAGDLEAAMRLSHKHRQAGSYHYRPCTACPANQFGQSVSPTGVFHPLYIGPIIPGHLGPIGAIQLDGFWVEFCIEEIEALGGWETIAEHPEIEQQLRNLGRNILRGPQD